MIQLSSRQAQKLVLNSQRLPLSGFPRGLKGVQSAIEHLGYIQIDTISVVERAHHHTLWARVPHYRHHYLDKLVAARTVLEYWSHAAAYLPMQDYRFCLPRMHALSSGQRHWYKRNPKLMAEILAQVKSDGPTQAKDFEQHTQYSGGMWDWGPVKQSIEQLFMEGKLLVTRRQKFQKVFDLAERVVPSDIDTKKPTQIEHAHFLVTRFIRANGLGRSAEFGYLRQGMGNAIEQAICEQIEAGDLLTAMVGRDKQPYYIASDFEQVLDGRLARSRVSILSPFDNLLIQRKRMSQIFDFDYQLECYVPAAKRKQGYFCLPIMWQGRLVARMDAKADRKQKILIIHRLIIEPGVNNIDGFAVAFEKSAHEFAQFNGCESINLLSTEPESCKSLFSAQVACNH